MSAALDVIICDASEFVRQGIATILKEMLDCCLVGDAATGTTAVQQAVRLAPHLVLIDVRMVEMEGMVPVRTIREALPDSKIVIVTDADDDDTVMDALAAGADSYCLKNRPSSLLKHAVQATLDGASWLDPSVGMRMVRSADRFRGVKAPQRQLVQAAAAEEKFRLSPREYDVLRLLAEGCSNREIAAKLWISTETVKTHVGKIIAKLEVYDRTEAALKALRERLI